MIMASSGAGATLHHLAHCFPSAPLPTLHPAGRGRGTKHKGQKKRRGGGDSRAKESEERNPLGPEAQQSPPPSPALDRRGEGRR